MYIACRITHYPAIIALVIPLFHSPAGPYIQIQRSSPWVDFFPTFFFFFFRQKGITFSVFIAAYPEASSLLSDTTLSSFRLLTTLSSPFVSFGIFLPGFLDTVSVSQPLFHNVHSKHVTLASFIKHWRLLLSSFIIDGNRFKTWFWSSDDMPVARNPDFKFSEDNRLIDRANNNDNGSASGSWEYNHLS